MKTPRALSFLLAASLLFAGAAGLRAEEKSLLAPDGTLYSVRSGLAADLGVSAPGIRPTDNLIEWTSVAQDGKHALGIIPNTTSANSKTNLDLAFDTQSGSLVLLWREELSVLNVLHLGLFKGGAWKSLDLLPNLGFAHAYNPQMLLSHQVVHWIDDDGKDAWKTRSLLSVIWWEESQFAQARYAPIFLDEDTSASDVAVYDLPKMVGSDGAETSGDVAPENVRLSVPAARGARRRDPRELRRPREGPGLRGPRQLPERPRRRELEVVAEAPHPGVRRRARHAAADPDGKRDDVRGLDGDRPVLQPDARLVEDAAVKFLRYDIATGKWSNVRAIALGDDMSKDRALSLVRDMASKN